MTQKQTQTPAVDHATVTLCDAMGCDAVLPRVNRAGNQPTFCREHAIQFTHRHGNAQ